MSIVLENLYVIYHCMGSMSVGVQCILSVRSVFLVCARLTASVHAHAYSLEGTAVGIVYFMIVCFLCSFRRLILRWTGAGRSTLVGVSTTVRPMREEVSVSMRTSR